MHMDFLTNAIFLKAKKAFQVVRQKYKVEKRKTYKKSS